MRFQKKMFACMRLIRITKQTVVLETCHKYGKQGSINLREDVYRSEQLPRSIYGTLNLVLNCLEIKL